MHDSRKQGNDSISSLLRYQRWMMCACASTNLECISNVCTVLRKVRRVEVVVGDILCTASAQYVVLVFSS